jgi:Tol biopolymer transport system component
MRSVVILAVIVLLGAVPVACGGSEAAPTATPAATATAAVSPTSLATATQPPSTVSSGQIAFSGVPEGASANGIYLVGSDGAGLEAAWTWETNGSHAVALVWSPAGRQLAFYGHDAGTESVGLYVLDANQGSVTRLHDGDFYGLPTWSLDGSQVYISVPRTSAVVDGGILAVPVDGSEPTWLISLDELGTQIPTMKVSPDGQTIAFMTGGPSKLTVVSVDDPLTRVVVGDDLFIDGDPVWSPDSRQIAFVSLQPLPATGNPNAYGQGQLYVVNADGTGLSQVTDFQPPEAYQKATPVWSPDGQQIAYTVSHTATPEPAQSEVYVSSVDGLQTRNLSNDPEHMDFGPSWSPDGREVTFVSQPVEAWRAGEEPMIADIRVVMADGTNPRMVVAGVQFESYLELIGRPDW